jgi:hydrogenase/urease accessory protein HupE
MSISKNIAVVFICILTAIPFSGFAHEMRPAFLHIRQTGANEYELLWKIPRIGNEVMSIKPEFPSWFVVQQKIPATESGTGALYTYHATSAKDIHGMAFSINGLKETVVDVLVQVELMNGDQYSLMLQPAKNKGKVPKQSGVLETIKGYFSLGVKHILLGIDHLLFVLALLLITKGMKRLFITVTAFTIAHSITLSLSALGYVGLPGPPVEAVIALSIVFLAVEIIREHQGIATLTGRKPWLVAFIFGLLHGLGFASALSQVGLPQQHIPLALGFFNVGVEAGQIAFIVVVLLIIRMIAAKKEWPIWMKKIPAYSIGSVAVFWLIERFTGFWNL